MELEFPIKISCDYDVIIALAKYSAENVECSLIRQFLFRHTAYPSVIAKELNGKSVKEIMGDSWLGEIRKDKDGNKCYTNLLSIFTLDTMVRSGKLKLYMTPAQYYSAMKRDICHDYINKYVTKLTVEQKDLDYFLSTKDSLIKSYKKFDAISDSYMKDGELKTSVEAPIKIAESSIFGLNMLTKRRDIYISRADYDYDRICAVRYVNSKHGLKFPNALNDKVPITAFTPNGFASHILSVTNDRGIPNEFDLVDNNVSEDNTFIKKY